MVECARKRDRLIYLFALYYLKVRDSFCCFQISATSWREVSSREDFPRLVKRHDFLSAVGSVLIFVIAVEF